MIAAVITSSGLAYSPDLTRSLISFTTSGSRERFIVATRLILSSTVLHSLASRTRILQHLPYSLQKFLPSRAIAEHQLLIAEQAAFLQPRQKLRRRTQAENLAAHGGVVIAGRLVVEHHIIRTGHAHEVIATGGRQEQHEIVG